jgi:hypothetical protein
MPRGAGILSMNQGRSARETWQGDWEEREEMLETYS